MTEKEFINWLRGFTEGVHHYNITPKQWDYLKETLKLTKLSKKTHNYTINSNHWFTTRT